MTGVHPDLALHGAEQGLDWQALQAGWRRHRQAGRHAGASAAPQSILILSVSAGAGHVQAAHALRAAAVAQGVHATHLDLMECVGRGYRKLYTDYYLGLVRRWPRAWGWLYDTTNHLRADGRLHRARRATECWLARRLHRRIGALRPDLIVCTHFLPAEILAAAPPGCPVWVQVTDYDLHQAWVQPGMAGYFAANDEVAFMMRAAGIPAGSVRVTGIPLMPGFARDIGRQSAAHALGLDPALPTVLLMGGGAGLGDLATCAARLLGATPDFQLIVLTGHNTAALRALQEMCARFPGRLFPQPYTRQVDRIMACCDLAITKPGGLSVSECLARGLPMILHAPIPGQEERNADMLLEQGVALKGAGLAGVEFRLRALLADPARRAAMAERARSISRPHAARDAIAHLLLQAGEAPAWTN